MWCVGLVSSFIVGKRVILKENMLGSPSPRSHVLSINRISYPSSRACSAELIGAEGILNALLAL